MSKDIKHVKLGNETYDIKSVNDLTAEQKAKLEGIQAGAQANVIETIQIDGEPVTLTGKIANLTGLQKTLQAGAGIEITGNTIKCTLTIFKVVTELPASPEAEDVGKIHVVLNAAGEGQNVFKEYIFVNNAWEEVGTSTVNVDLTDYAKTSDVNDLLATKVDKETGKGLSTNDYTTAEKDKLAGISVNANNVQFSVDDSTETLNIITD